MTEDSHEGNANHSQANNHEFFALGHGDDGAASAEITACTNERNEESGSKESRANGKSPRAGEFRFKRQARTAEKDARVTFSALQNALLNKVDVPEGLDLHFRHAGPAR
jgi:hypothetical protein